METRDAALAKAASAAHGHVTAAVLRALGLDCRAVARRVEAGVLVPVHLGVHRHAAVLPSRAGRLHGAVLAAGPTAVASHRSAAWLQDLRDVPRWRPEVTVPGTRMPVLQGVEVHRTDRLDAIDVTRVEGIHTTSVARTLLSLGAVVPAHVVETATQDALIRRLATEAQLLSALERLGGRGRRGVAALRGAVVAGLPPAGAQSRLEADLLALLGRAGLVPPALQHELRTGVGLVRLDAAWPEQRLAVEADGRRWHSTKADFQRDLRRSRSIVAVGWRHVRYGWADVHDDPIGVVAEVRALLQTPSVEAA